MSDDEAPRNPYKPEPPKLSLMKAMQLIAIAVHTGATITGLYQLFFGGPTHSIVAAILLALIAAGWAVWATNQDREDRAAHMFGPSEDPVQILSDMHDDTGTGREL